MKFFWKKNSYRHLLNRREERPGHFARQQQRLLVTRSAVWQISYSHMDTNRCRVVKSSYMFIFRTQNHRQVRFPLCGILRPLRQFGMKKVCDFLIENPTQVALSTRSSAKITRHDPARLFCARRTQNDVGQVEEDCDPALLLLLGADSPRAGRSVLILNHSLLCGLVCTVQTVGRIWDRICEDDGECVRVCVCTCVRAMQVNGGTANITAVWPRLRGALKMGACYAENISSDSVAKNEILRTRFIKYRTSVGARARTLLRLTSQRRKDASE
jgi:hypothetical protein